MSKLYQRTKKEIQQYLDSVYIHEKRNHEIDYNIKKVKSKAAINSTKDWYIKLTQNDFNRSDTGNIYI